MLTYTWELVSMNNIELLTQADVLIKACRFNEAERIYLEMLVKLPDDPILQAFLGRLYIRQRRYKSAERILQKSYDKRKSAAAISALAFCKMRLLKFDDAIILYEELFKYDKDSPKIYSKIIDSFKELQMFEFAHAYAQKFYNKHPELDNAMVRLTQSYLDIGDVKTAESFCAKTIQKFPKCPEIWIVAGTLQEFLYCNEELAQECYFTAIENGGIVGYYHLGVSYIKTGQFDKAEESLLKIIKLLPQDKISKAALGTLYLAKKDFKRGYEYFFNRDKAPEISLLENHWDGSEQKSSTLLLYCDQGLGDHLQFIRYLPFLTEKFEKIKVLTRKPCVELFKRNYAQYENVEFYTQLSDIKIYDHYVLASDLPYFLNIGFDDIPFNNGYLTPNATKVEYFKQKYFNNNKLKIGLCWRAGGIGIRSAINRTVNIEYFKNILNLADTGKVQFYSVQLDDIFDGCKKYPQITDLKPEITDFDDTLAIINNCDIFLTVDTSCAHLAGAVGKKTFLLLPYCADWRWFSNNKSTEWYSSIELFKQQDRQDWFIEVDKITEILKELL